ncbi:uncharacterized protein LOC129001462 isoform X2 [Macrosteles quadrilineatus]|uniref:uncharacterized protein LOC129001462 isoform X2 n=1 Tax=Macrosteles quadrilineatus TaxID=74068 RepID=UPI0023E307CE|nr:uncharacterized protein LOC129001462 isoform X2 [Macrosteles quadrilineatus]
MEEDKTDCSTFSVPGAMSDMTILSTPLPQAASTATKSRSLIGDDDLCQQARDFYAEVEAFCNPSSSGGLSATQKQELMQISEKHMKTDPGQALKLTDEGFNSNNIFRVPTVPNLSKNNKAITLKQTDSKTKKRNIPRSSDSNVANKSSLKLLSTQHTVTSPGKELVTDNKNIKSPKQCSTPTVTPSTRKVHSYLDDTPAKLPAKYQSTKDLTSIGDERMSIASSANSSLGVIPSELLCDAQREPLVDINQDLSIRLAEKLNLNTSLLKDGLDISALASERYREKLAAKYESKENQHSGRISSDYWTLHGYSSDNCDSKNNTAKRLSSLSSKSDGETDLNKSRSSSRRSLKPLSEINSNSTSPRLTSNSRSERFSLGSNPFGSYTNVSVNSEDFQFTEDASQRLNRDERQFSIASARSLSGIYGDANTSVNVGGEKLSISGFLRSGSGPLGSLGTGDGVGDSQRPQFGMISTSPEKTGKPRPIMPPPDVDEEPVRDTPWLPHSLVEQYSNIHGDEADTSVPSLSYIGELLEKLQHGANHKEVLDQLMGSQTKAQTKPNESIKPKPNRISSIVEGDNSFCQGVEGNLSFSTRDNSALQYSNFDTPMNESGAMSVCNVTDFEGDEDACVCVMTPQSMDFDVFNELSHPAEYSFSKACYVDGQRKDSAAYVHFPVPKMILYPGQRKTLTINIAALIGGVIKIKIEVTRKNPLTQARECSNVFGKIIAEIPKVSLLTKHKGEMIPNPECQHNGKYQHTIVMKNEGRSTVPLKLTVTKVTHEEVLFHFGGREKQTVTVMVDPGQIVRQPVLCEIPPIFAHLEPADTIIPVEGTVEFLLATTDLYQLNPVAPVTLVATLRPYFFGAPATLAVPSDLPLYNNSDQPVVLRTSSAFGYTVQPSSFTVPSNQTFVVHVDTAETRNPLRCGELTLHTVFPPDMQSHFTIKLQEDRRTSHSSNNSLATPHSSRAASPTSPGSSSSLATPVGELKVACSHKQLVWGGCHLHQKVFKTFCIKNMGRHREKLRLTVMDNAKCFKIVSDEETLQSEIKLSLQPMDNREIKLAVLATVQGPLWGHLTISRICRAVDKNVLPLYAFGGKPTVNISQGVFEVDSRQYLFLDEKSLESSIALSNSGDSSAFFRITEATFKSSAGLSICPQEGVLQAGQTATIRVGLLVTAQRLEYLLRQTTRSVSVAQLSIHLGDESTRQRLLRTRGLYGVLSTRVSQLSCIPSKPIPDLDKLDVSATGAEDLWEEDTNEWAVGVLINRKALEALRLDTSVDFVDLSTTMSKH